MYKRVFIDANIFIDANDNSRKSYEESFEIVPYLLENGIGIYTSCDLITTIYYILAKEDRAKALDSIEQINQFCTVIDFDNKEVQLCCDLMRSDSNFTDLEDTLQYILAQKTQCDLIISNDARFYSKEIELMSGEEFVGKIDIST
ncbi:MAG: PIN domain-containing protein [Campylobacterota bacterium]|nr:PIN domain-containing protein [Campylobacterota bacterium]